MAFFNKCKGSEAWSLYLLFIFPLSALFFTAVGGYDMMMCIC